MSKTSYDLHSGLSDFADLYDAYICDLWGVLHDGVTAFPDAVATLARLKQDNKKIFILSNAPRRSSEVEGRMNDMGIDPSLYDRVLSSGEQTWTCLKDRPDSWYQTLGRRCLHLGPDRDHGMRDGLDLDIVQDPAEADFLLNTGAKNATDLDTSYDDILVAAQKRGLKMVCANPDLEVIRGGKREICAGALARRYEDLGGEVRYHGKPHAEIYQECQDYLKDIPAKRIAMIGDSLRTDIAGARSVGIGAILVVGGIHAESLGVAEGQLPERTKLDALCSHEGHWPDQVLPALRW
ncbi:TIGR01459 family HAD-type hydrolase [Rhodovibrionaceae bacterium A322]